MQFLDQIIFTFARVYYKQQQKTSFCICQHFEKLPKFCVITSVYELFLVLSALSALINSIIFIGNQVILFF